MMLKLKTILLITKMTVSQILMTKTRNSQTIQIPEWKIRLKLPKVKTHIVPL